MTLKTGEKIEIGKWAISGIIGCIVFVFGYLTNNVKSAMSVESKIEMINYRVESINTSLNDIKEIKTMVNQLVVSDGNKNTEIVYIKERLSKVEQELKEIKK